MYEQDACWNVFYMELEPEKRQEMLEELVKSQPDDGANEYRKILLKRRYNDPKNPTAKVDSYLWQCVNLPFLYKNAKFFTKKNKKELHAIWKETGFDLAEKYGEAGEKALYWEIRNTMKRYFKTCTDKSYGRKIFGLVSANDEERSIRICKDAFSMSYGLAGKLEEEETMAIFNQAVKDEYSLLDDNAVGRFAEYERELALKMKADK